MNFLPPDAIDVIVIQKGPIYYMFRQGQSDGITNSVRHALGSGAARNGLNKPIPPEWDEEWDEEWGLHRSWTGREPANIELLRLRAELKEARDRQAEA